MRRTTRATLAPSTATSVSLLAGCTDREGSDTDGKASLEVIAAFYPLEEAARGVGGDLVSGTSPTPPGQGPHDLELEPSRVGLSESADVVLHLGRGFRPQAEQSIEQAPDSLTRVVLLDEAPC